MRFASLLVALLTMGCGVFDPRPSDPLAELAVHRERWQRLAIRDYDYDVTYANEWFPPKSVRIEVRDGNVTRVTDRSTGEIILANGWPTVDSLFARAERNLREPERVVELRYDPLQHYPTLLTADAPHWADDAESYHVSGLVRR